MAQQVNELRNQQSRKRQLSPIFGTLNKKRIVYSKKAKKRDSTRPVYAKRSRPALRMAPRQQPPELAPIDQPQHSHQSTSSLHDSDSSHEHSPPPTIASNRASKRSSAQQVASQRDNSKQTRKTALRKVGKYDKDGNRLSNQMFSQKPLEITVKTKKFVMRNRLVCLPDLLPPQDIANQDNYLQDHNVDANEELSDSASVSSDGIEARPIGYSLSALRRQVKRCTLQPKDLSRARRRQHALSENGNGKVISDGFEPHEVELRRRPFWRSRRVKTTFLPFRHRLQMVGDVLSKSRHRIDYQYEDAVNTSVVQDKEKQAAADQPENINNDAANDEPYAIDAYTEPCVIEENVDALDHALHENIPSPVVHLPSITLTRPERTPAQMPRSENVTQARSSIQVPYKPIDTIAALTSAYELYCNESAQRRQSTRSAAEPSELHERSSVAQMHTHRAMSHIASQATTLRAPRWSTTNSRLNADSLDAVDIEVSRSQVLVLATSPTRMGVSV